MIDPLSGDTESGALAGALQWLQALLLGPVASTIAIIAVAGIGYGLLSGRIDLRRAATVTMGCFLIFGAPAIVGGMTSRRAETEVRTVANVPPPPPVTALSPEMPAYDPYAGASVPPDR